VSRSNGSGIVGLSSYLVRALATRVKVVAHQVLVTLIAGNILVLIVRVVIAMEAAEPLHMCVHKFLCRNYVLSKP
jgi:hypothetical protein